MISKKDKRILVTIADGMNYASITELTFECFITEYVYKIFENSKDVKQAYQILRDRYHKND